MQYLRTTYSNKRIHLKNSHHFSLGEKIRNALWGTGPWWVNCYHLYAVTCWKMWKSFGKSTCRVQISHIQNPLRHSLLPTLLLVSPRFSKKPVSCLPWAYTVEWQKQSKKKKEKRRLGWGELMRQESTWVWLIPVQIWGNLPKVFVKPWRTHSALFFLFSWSCNLLTSLFNEANWIGGVTKGLSPSKRYVKFHKIVYI